MGRSIANDCLIVTCRLRLILNSKWVLSAVVFKFRWFFSVWINSTLFNFAFSCLFRFHWIQALVHYQEFWIMNILPWWFIPNIFVCIRNSYLLWFLIEFKMFDNFHAPSTLIYFDWSEATVYLWANCFAIILHRIFYVQDTGRDESATKEIIFGIVTRMDLLRFITNEAQASGLEEEK